MSEISKQTKKLIEQYKKWHYSLEPKEGITTVHVDEVASRVAAFYEKIREFIDWKEEHLLKKGVIERNLRRRMLPHINLSAGEFIKIYISAEPLVLELIRSGHFPNNSIEELKIKEVQRVIDKYIQILNNSPADKNDSRLNLYQWISSIAACEIEEILSPSIKERALMEHMYEQMKTKIKLSKDQQISEEEKNIQIFVSIQKALFDLDYSVISYHLIKYKFPNWSNLSPEYINIVASGIYDIKNGIDANLNHPLAGKINNICQRYNTPYFILDDIISEDPLGAEEKMMDPKKLESLIKEKYNKRVKNLRIKIRRAAFYSIISIFITDILFLFTIEIQLTRYFGQFTMTSTLVNIFVPTMLMAFLALTVKDPPKGNIEKVIMETIKIAYEREKKETYDIKSFRKRGPIFGLIITAVYLLSTLASIGVIVWGLNKINFPPFSYPIFITFLSLIAFAGTKIRQKARALQMVEERDTFLDTLVDFFALPIIHLGRWLTIRWKRYNLLSTLFNALLDMPYSIFVEFIEQWRYFLKEKKEKL